MPGKKHVRGVSAKEHGNTSTSSNTSTSKRARKNPAATETAPKKWLHARCSSNTRKKGIARDISPMQSRAGISKVIEEPLYCVVALIRARVECDSNSIGG